MRPRNDYLYISFVLAMGLLGCDDNDPNETKNDDTTPEERDTSETLFKNVFEDKLDDEAASLFDPTGVVEIRLTLPPDVWEQLIIDARDEQYVSAEVDIDGTSQGEVGLRFKGAYGNLYPCFDENDALICPKLSMKIKFNEYDDEKRFMGLKRINLHSPRWDQSLMKEYFSYKLFREMGIPTSRVGYAYVHVNDEPIGLFTLVEQIDGRFTDSRFVEGDGNLYKEIQLEADEEAMNEGLRTNKDIADHTVYKDYAEEMTDAEDDELIDVLTKWMSPEYLMKYMAVDDTIFNWDGITAFYCGEGWGCINHNFYLYQEETAKRFWLIPWDMDATLDSYNWMPTSPWNDRSVDCDEWIESENVGSEGVRPACGDPFLRALSLYQESSDRYDSALKHLVEEVFDVDAYKKEVDKIAAALESYVEADPDRSLNGWSNAVRGIKQNIESAHYDAVLRLDDRHQRE
jgi:spore coat protein H